MLAKSSIQSFFASAARVMNVVAAIAFGAGLAACTSKADSATQVVAKVNAEELSIHQVNYLLQRQQGLRPEQTEIVSRQILERLIDQELAIQKAEDLKVDRQPEAIQAIAAARREIISRAYLDRVSNAASRPKLNERKRQLVEKDIKWLCDSGKIQYVGKFAVSSGSAPTTGALTVPPTTARPALLLPGE
jgi:SurA N-terminal domain